MDGDTDKYAWEAEYKKSWDVLKTDQDLVNTTKRVRSRTDTPIQRGIIRQLCLCIDLSSCMAQLDFAPNRVHVVMAQCTHFITEFFDQNPISHIMLVGITNGVAECWSEWCGNPTMLIQSLSTHKVPAGNASLVNCLEMCSKRLMHAPSHVSREVLVVYGSLNTTDPTNIYDTLSDLVQLNMRVSIIGLSAFMNICNETCKKTGGVYRVALDEMHLKDLFFEHVAPPPLRGARHCLIQMGFPTVQTFSKAVWCAWYYLLIQPYAANRKGLYMSSVRECGVCNANGLPDMHFGACIQPVACQVLPPLVPRKDVRSSRIHSKVLCMQ